MDPLMVAVTAAVYVIVVAIAVIVPASRALRIQPATILRAE
jgi:ABC-type lipoprotein release transport system permease subunit